MASNPKLKLIISNITSDFMHHNVIMYKCDIFFYIIKQGKLTFKINQSTDTIKINKSVISTDLVSIYMGDPNYIIYESRAYDENMNGSTSCSHITCAKLRI